MISAEIAKSIATTIVAMKSVLSKPRRVWKAELKLSLPPNAPPICAPVFWRSMAVTSITASTICMYGSMEAIIFIGDTIAYL